MNYGPFTFTSYPCALCGSVGRSVVMHKAAVIVDRTFEIVRCDDCGHHYVDPRIADDELGQLYDDQYYRAGGFDTSTNYFAPASDYTRRVANDVVDTIASSLDRPLRGARCLDIGCGPGHLLETLHAGGADALGFDDSDAAMRICAERDLETVSQRELDGLAGTFDVVTAIEVIEHVPKPDEFLRFLASLLRIGGVAYVQTGNWNTVKLVTGTPYVMPEGHIHYFTPPEMRGLFRRCGLRESKAFNRSWFPYRDGPAFIRTAIPIDVLAVAGRAAQLTMTGYAPFPVGIRVS